MALWKHFISRLPLDYTLNRPIETGKLQKAEELLGVSFPDELVSLLKMTNGINDTFGDHLIWPADRIIEENLDMRCTDCFKPFDCLLFIAGAGNGDLFAYSILNGSIRKNDIYVWNHIDDSRIWVAPSLKSFIKGWIDGTITI
ncbi:SMI1/KNR4 family protein [Bacillus licheniformis]|nr:SMI1/KNR4 family protein [Bacillus licheniformis]MED0714026.1 SMI1/KNR4 family protein [Bacillus licheniformis]MED0791644.1 SMI1/KNR4 family protein [Bacillus licheniformis]